MTAHLFAAAAPLAMSIQNLVTYLQGLFGPLFLGIVAIFFLFTDEITRFVQFIVLAVASTVAFYTPCIVQAPATGKAIGVQRPRLDRRSAFQRPYPLTRIPGGSKRGSTSFTTFSVDNYLQDSLVYESANGICRQVVGSTEVVGTMTCAEAADGGIFPRRIENSVESQRVEACPRLVKGPVLLRRNIWNLVRR